MFRRRKQERDFQAALEAAVGDQVEVACRRCGKVDRYTVRELSGGGRHVKQFVAVYLCCGCRRTVTIEDLAMLASRGLNC